MFVSPPPAAPRIESASSFGGIGAVTPVSDGFRITWDPVLDDAGAPSPDYAYQVFWSFGGAPIDFSLPSQVTGLGVGSTEVRGLAPGTVLSVAVQADSQVDPTDQDDNQVQLDGVVAPLWYVDAGAAGGGDGRSPSTPFSTIGQAVQAALSSLQVANVLVATGSYREVVTLSGDVHLYGGFDVAFAGRDRSSFPAVLRAPPLSATALRVTPSGFSTLVDGFEIDGGGDVDKGVIVRDADLQLTNCDVFNQANEGIAVSTKGRPSLLRLHRVKVQGVATEGLDARGSMDAQISDCDFSDNGREGAEFDNLSVQPGGLSRLWVRDCRFERNGNDGLDIDLNELFPSQGNSSNGGRIEILIERCLAADNARRGLLVDVDYQDVDQIDSSVVLRGNLACRQRGDGIQIDADATSRFLLAGNRTVASQNRGVSIGGASDGALVVVTNHWDLGATTAGVQCNEVVPAVLSHVAVTGTGAPSVTGNGATLLVNGALWLAAPPSAADVTYSYADVPLPGPGNLGGLPGVQVAPLELFVLVAAGVDRDQLPVPAGVTLAAGDWIELGNDEVPRQVLRVQGGVAFYSPAASAPPAAGSLVGRFAAPDVKEDPTLLPGSRWQDAGDPISRDLDGTVTDVGVLGGLLEDFRPQRLDPWMPFLADHLQPPPGPATAPVARIEVGFSQDLDPSSVDATSVVVTLDGQVVAGGLTVLSRRVEFEPSVPMTGGEIEVALHGTLRSVRGDGLSLPFRYRILAP